MNSELMVVLEYLEHERGIDRETLIQLVEESLTAAGRKSVPTEQEVTVRIDRMTGERLGPSTGDPRAFASFEEVLAAFTAQVEHFVAMKVRYDNIVRGIYADHCPVPFTSAVIDEA